MRSALRVDYRLRYLHFWPVVLEQKNQVLYYTASFSVLPALPLFPLMLMSALKHPCSGCAADRRLLDVDQRCCDCFSLQESMTRRQK